MQIERFSLTAQIGLNSLLKPALTVEGDLNISKEVVTGTGSPSLIRCLC